MGEAEGLAARENRGGKVERRSEESDEVVRLVGVVWRGREVGGGRGGEGRGGRESGGGGSWATGEDWSGAGEAEPWNEF